MISALSLIKDIPGVYKASHLNQKAGLHVTVTLAESAMRN